MRFIGLAVVIVAFMGSCNTESNQATRSGCKYQATVVDMAGLDGCGILFRINDDELIEPIEWNAEKPELEVGETYLINYDEIPSASICMAGNTVRMTCITSANKSEKPLRKK